MGRTILYIVLLAVVGFGVYYFVFKDHDAYSKGEAAFNVPDTSKVGKLFLADKKGRTILAERKGGVWMVNGQYIADDGTVNSILETLKRQTAAHPVPNTAYDNVIRELAGDAVKVEVYDTKGDKMLVFYVVGQVPNSTGSYMMMEGSEQPYVVQIPGFQGYLSSRYATNLERWRDRAVFNVPQEQLKEVKVTYPAEPLNSFTLKQESEGVFTIVADPQLVNGKTANARNTNIYSKYFAGVYCEGFINGTPRLDTFITAERKRCEILVTTKDNKTQMADIYWMPINKRSKNMLTPAPGVPIQYDADRFYAVINDHKDTVIVQAPTFSKMFRKAYEFYMGDETQEVNRIEVPRGAGDVIHPTDKK